MGTAAFAAGASCPAACGESSQMALLQDPGSHGLGTSGSRTLLLASWQERARLQLEHNTGHRGSGREWRSLSEGWTFLEGWRISTSVGFCGGLSLFQRWMFSDGSGVLLCAGSWWAGSSQRSWRSWRRRSRAGGLAPAAAPGPPTTAATSPSPAGRTPRATAASPGPAAPGPPSRRGCSRGRSRRGCTGGSRGQPARGEGSPQPGGNREPLGLLGRAGTPRPGSRGASVPSKCGWPAGRP